MPSRSLISLIKFIEFSSIYLICSISSWIKPVRIQSPYFHKVLILTRDPTKTSVWEATRSSLNKVLSKKTITLHSMASPAINRFNLVWFNQQLWKIKLIEHSNLRLKIKIRYQCPSNFNMRIHLLCNNRCWMEVKF